MFCSTSLFPSLNIAAAKALLPVYDKGNKKRGKVYAQGEGRTFFYFQGNADHCESEVICVFEGGKGKEWQPLILTYLCVISSPTRKSAVNPFRVRLVYLFFSPCEIFPLPAMCSSGKGNRFLIERKGGENFFPNNCITLRHHVFNLMQIACGLNQVPHIHVNPDPQINSIWNISICIYFVQDIS